MNVGDLVRVRGNRGIIVKVPPEDDYWGETAIILFFDGSLSEWERDLIAFLRPLKSGGYGVDEAKSYCGKHGNKWPINRGSNESR